MDESKELMMMSQAARARTSRRLLTFLSPAVATILLVALAVIVPVPLLPVVHVAAVLPGVYTLNGGLCKVPKNVSQSDCEAIADAVEAYTWRGASDWSGEPGCNIGSSMGDTYYRTNKKQTNGKECGGSGYLCLCLCPSGRYSDRSGTATPPDQSEGCKQCSKG